MNKNSVSCLTAKDIMEMATGFQKSQVFKDNFYRGKNMFVYALFCKHIAFHFQCAEKIQCHEIEPTEINL